MSVVNREVNNENNSENNSVKEENTIKISYI